MSSFFPGNPTCLPIRFPLLNTASVGKPCTEQCSATAGAVSTFTLKNFICLYLPSNSSSIGSRFLHGLHHSAQKSTTAKSLLKTALTKSPNVFKSSIKNHAKIEKAYADTDLKATDAVIELYEKGVPITQIQKAFSAGTLGTEKRRRFVPTRWAITAVDDIVSKHNMDKIKQYPIIEEPAHFSGEYLGNIWEIDFLPRAWSFKMTEEWLANKSLGITDKQVGVSEEGFDGRKTYAEIGGSYYACRVSVTEKLVQMKRQASVIVRRTITDKYSLPVGVWQIRTNVKMVLDQ